MKTNQEFKNEALAALRGNWTPAVLATVMILAIALVVTGPSVYSSIQMRLAMSQMTTMNAESLFRMIQRTNGFASLQMVLSIFILFPITIGFTNACKLLLFKGDDRIPGNTFKIAFTNYWHKVWGYFLMYILVCLWMLLLIIPGIIKAFSYAMTPYILEDHPELSARDAIHLSRTMMRGHKFDLFYLYLGFLGWGILCLFTAGIGFLWLTPYMQTSTAAFYREVKGAMGDEFDAQVRSTANL